MTLKICERCGISFECKPENINECQCSTTILHENTSLFLRNSFFDCLCKNCLLEIDVKLQDLKHQDVIEKNRFVENVHYYCEGQKYVFKEAYLLSRGYCCQSGCRHCPYGFNTNTNN